jgi:hypothetical protein
MEWYMNGFYFLGISRNEESIEKASAKGWKLYLSTENVQDIKQKLVCIP